MRTRNTIAAVTAVLAITLAGCSSDDSNDQADSAKGSTPAATATADNNAAEEAVGIPAEPDAATRTALIEVLKAINPALVADEDKAIDNARNQCSTINGGGNADASAQARFSTSEHEVTQAEAQAINAALKASLCTS
jgi:peptidoglycan hydrolase-like protein with peptidoglycan-binding domain